MSGSAAPILVTASDVAALAGVGPSAVANWRKRHSDFPHPGSNDRFDLAEVERWLIENGKISSAIPAHRKFWWLLDALDASAPVHIVTSCVTACLLYVEVLDREDHSDTQKPSGTADTPFEWSDVREVPDEDLLRALALAGGVLEEHDPELVALLVVGFARGIALDPDLVRSIIDVLHDGRTSDQFPPRHEILDDVLERARGRDHFRAELTTPDVLATLIARLGGPPRAVLDLAAGEGALLMAIRNEAGRSQASTEPDLQFYGYEGNFDLVRIARSRFYLHREHAEIHHADTFTVPKSDMPDADLVVVDPPLGQADWGDADIYLSDRWIYGTPPKTSSSFAWLQLAIEAVAEGGTAIVVTGASALSRGGQEGSIRLKLVSTGCVRSVVLLPARTRPETTVPLAIWVVGHPDEARRTVNLIDATGLGVTSRAGHDLSDEDIDLICSAVRGDLTPSDSPAAGDIAQIVDVEDLRDDADLNPARYRRAVTISTGTLRARQEAILEALPDDITERLVPMDDVAPGACHLVPLDELVEIQRPRSFKAVDPAEATDEMTARVIDGRELRGDAYRVVDPSTLTKPVIAAPGDVVITTIGLIESTVVDDEWAGAIVGQNSALLRITDRSRVLPEWIRLWTKSASYRDQVERHQVGAVIPRLSKQVLLAMTIPLPPLQIQQQAAVAALARAKEITMYQEVLRQLQALDEIEADLMMMGGGTE